MSKAVLTTRKINAILKDTLRRLDADDRTRLDMFRPQPIPADIMNRVIDSSRDWRGR